MKIYIKKIIGKIARLYHRIRSSWIIRERILNRKSSILFNAQKSKLSSKEQDIVNKLKEDGIAIVHISELFPESAFQYLREFAEKRWNHPEVIKRYKERSVALSAKDELLSKDYFLVNLWQGEKVLDLENMFTRFSLNDSILRIVNSYLGVFSKFRGWHLQVTTPMPKGARRYGSQEWHRDPEDQMLVKTFLYLNDVTEGAGPFIYLKKSQSGGKWRNLFPQCPPRGSIGREEDIPKEDVVTCVGKLGTLVFCDTSGLHRGGHATSDNRSMYTSVYTTPASVWPIVFSYDKTHDFSSLSAQALYAVTNNSHQRNPKFYKF